MDKFVHFQGYTLDSLQLYFLFLTAFLPVLAGKQEQMDTMDKQVLRCDNVTRRLLTKKLKNLRKADEMMGYDQDNEHQANKGS